MDYYYCNQSTLLDTPVEKYRTQKKRILTIKLDTWGKSGQRGGKSVYVCIKLIEPFVKACEMAWD